MAVEWFLIDTVLNKEYTLSPGENSIGRQLGSSVYTGSVYSSRRHCIIEVDQNDGEFIKIKDLASSNGTYLNGHMLLANRRVDVATGDLIGIGTHVEQEQTYYIFQVFNRPTNQVVQQNNDLKTQPQGSKIPKQEPDNDGQRRNLPIPKPLKINGHQSPEDINAPFPGPSRINGYQSPEDNNAPIPGPSRINGFQSPKNINPQETNSHVPGPSRINSCQSNGFKSSSEDATKSQQQPPHLSRVKQEGEKRKRNGDHEAIKEEISAPKIPKFGGFKDGVETNGRLEHKSGKSDSRVMPELMVINETGTLPSSVKETNNTNSNSTDSMPPSHSPRHSDINTADNHDVRNSVKRTKNSDSAHNMPPSHTSSMIMNPPSSAQKRDSRKSSLDRTKRFSNDEDIEILDISGEPSNKNAPAPGYESTNNPSTSRATPSVDLSNLNNQMKSALASYGSFKPCSKSSMLEETDKLLNASKHQITVSVQNSKTLEFNKIPLTSDSANNNSVPNSIVSDAVETFNSINVNGTDEDDYPYDEYDEFVEEDSKNWYGQLSQSMSQAVDFDDGREDTSNSSETTIGKKPSCYAADQDEDAKPLPAKPGYLWMLNDDNYGDDEEIESVARRTSRSVSSGSETETVRRENITKVLGEPITLSSDDSSDSTDLNEKGPIEPPIKASDRIVLENSSSVSKIDPVVPEVVTETGGTSEVRDKVLNGESKSKSRPRQAELIAPVPQPIRRGYKSSTIQKLQPKASEKKKSDSSCSKKSPQRSKSSKVSKSKEPQESPKDKQEMKETRKLKLAEISDKGKKKSEERSKNLAPKISAPVKTKITKENRSKCFIENVEMPSVPGPSKKSKDSENLQPPAPEPDFSMPSASKVPADKTLPSFIRRGQRERVSRVSDEQTASKSPILSAPSSGRKPSSASKSNLPKPKKVWFPPDDQLVEIKTYQPSEGDFRLEKVRGRKDAELPFLPQVESDDVILHEILKWRPDWLHEQERNTDHPPVTHNHPLRDVKLKYESIKEYYWTMKYLLQYELWQSITQDYKRHFGLGPVNQAVSVNARNIFNCLIDDCSIREVSSKPPRRFLQINCNVVLSIDDWREGHIPRREDLVILNLKYYDGPDKKAPPKTYTVFGYVNFDKKNKLSEASQMSLGPLLKLKEKPCAYLTLKIQIHYGTILENKCILSGPKDQSIMQIKVVEMKKIKSLVPEMRLFDALRAIPSYPLCNALLNVDKHNFSVSYNHQEDMIPALNKITCDLNSSQQKAVDYATKMCLSEEPNFCLIQGAPGTGKSLVISRIIQSILKCRDLTDDSKDYTILLCASSNAAVDELVVKLGEINRKANSSDKFNLVRAGRKEYLSDKAVPFSVAKIVERGAAGHDNVDGYYLDIDIRMMKAKENSLNQTIKNLESNLRKLLNKGGMTENDILLKTSWQEKKRRAEFDRNVTTNELRKLELMRTNQSPELTAKQKHLAKEDAENRVLKQAQVVAVTLSSCVSHQMKTVFMPDNKRAGVKSQISVCIIDEATQCSEIESLIPFLLGVKSVVLVGDPKQLSPTVLSLEAQKRGYGQSLFSRMMHSSASNQTNFPYFFLDTQYRMHSKICMWPNKYFYHSQLKTDPSVDEKLCKSPLLPYVVLSTNSKPSDESTEKNEDEANMVFTLVKEILKLPGCGEMSIGVITPYQKQKKGIQLLFNGTVPKAVECNTIDSYQGSEKDIIILSTVRTQGIGFLENQARLNVSLTRARSSLIIIGNFISLQDDPTWNALIQDAKSRKVFKRVSSSKNGKYLSYVLKQTDSHKRNSK